MYLSVFVKRCPQFSPREAHSNAAFRLVSVGTRFFRVYIDLRIMHLLHKLLECVPSSSLSMFIRKYKRMSFLCEAHRMCLSYFFACFPLVFLFLWFLKLLSPQILHSLFKYRRWSSNRWAIILLLKITSVILVCVQLTLHQARVHIIAESFRIIKICGM